MGISSFLNNAREKIASFIKPKRKLTVQELFMDLLNNNPIITVTIHTEVKGVILPEYIMKKDTKVISLQYGLNLATPIKDLSIGNDGISATLSFQRKPFKTFVPWESIIHMVGDIPPPVGPNNGGGNFIALKGDKEKEVNVDNEIPQKIAA